MRHAQSHITHQQAILLGYERVSTDDQYLNLHRTVLMDAGVTPRPLYEGTLSGAQADRPGLEHVLRVA